MIKKINSFIKAFLNWVDNPHSFLKIFQILFYYLPAFLTPIFCIILLNQTGIFMLIYFIPLVIFIVGILTVRAKEMGKTMEGNQKFFIISALGHYLKTSFEVLAVIILLMPLAFLLMSLGLSYTTGIDVPIISDWARELGNWSLIQRVVQFLLISLASIVYGYFVLFFGKFLYESFIAIAYIANNIKK